MIRDSSLRDRDASSFNVTGATQSDNQPLAGSAWNALAIILVALGILGQAWVGYVGRTTGSPSSVEYYLTLILIFIPPASVIASRRSSDQARVWFALYLAVALFTTRFMLYPNMFVYHDEIIHVHNVINIEATAHLFAPNSLLPVTPYYPGLEIATAAVQQLTGLSLHAAGTIVLLLPRIVMTLALIRIIQRVTGSVRHGCLAALIYSTNPQYIFFNSQFSYQTVALPLCLFCLYVFSIRQRSRGLLAVLPSAAVFLAVAVSHHLTSLALVALIWVWYLLTLVKRQQVSQLMALAILGLGILAVWTFVARSVVLPYIGGIVQSNLDGIIDLFRGTLGHTLFEDSAGDKAPTWEVLLSVASVVVISCFLVPALWFAVKRFKALSASDLVLAIVAAAGHLAAATGQAADRASGFIFMGLAYLFAAWWLSKDALQRRGRRYQFRVPRQTWGLVLALTLCFAGGTVGGSGPDWAYGPGKYLVSADNRSVDQLALQAAYWEGQNLPPNSRVFTDRVNGLLAETYGNQHVLTSLGDGIKVGTLSVLLLTKPAPGDGEVACQARVQFLIADQRLSTQLPHVDAYIDNGEYLYGIREAPPPADALTKFDNVPGAERIFDNGAVRIYDLRGLACESGR